MLISRVSFASNILCFITIVALQDSHSKSTLPQFDMKASGFRLNSFPPSEGTCEIKSNQIENDSNKTSSLTNFSGLTKRRLAKSLV